MELLSIRDDDAAAQNDAEANLANVGLRKHICVWVLMGSAIVKDQIHICNLEVAQLARTFARQTGKTIGEVVLEALRQYRSRCRPAPQNQVKRWRLLLREDRKRDMAGTEVPLEALYDKFTGLPT